MLTIRQAQFEAMQSLADEGAIRRLEAHLAEHHPECLEGLTAEQRRDRVAHAMARGRHYGLTRERALGDFCRRTLVAWPDFEANPHMASALRRVSQDSNPDARYALLDIDLAQMRTGTMNPPEMR